MYCAVDIGGTKTLIAVFDDAGKVLEQIKFPTPQEYEAFLGELANNVAKLSTKDFRRFAVAVPGKVDHRQGLLLAAGNLSWENVPVQADIERLFHTPTTVENDAKAAAVAEARAAGTKYPKVVYVTISTGVGIGVCQNGKLVPELLDAELGWMEVEHNGKMVVWEKIASGKALYERYGQRASELEDNKAWDEHARGMAKGLIAIIAIIQPDLIVFGGGVGNHLAKFEKPLLKYLRLYESPIVPIPPIRKATHPEEAVTYGCYELAKDSAK